MQFLHDRLLKITDYNYTGITGQAYEITATLWTPRVQYNVLK